MSEIPVISLFTGGGFMDTGFIEAGFRMVWTNENDPSFVRMYKSGMTSWRRASDPAAPEVAISEERSITEVRGRTIIARAFGKKKPDLFGVIGGPPCPDFSLGGKNRGHNGDKGRLTRTFFERIVEISPHFFVMENVLGLIKTQKHKEFLDQQRKYLGENGIYTNYKVLNALNYGVPQDRERVFMIGLFGGFTTFSSFSLETLALVQDGQWLQASGNVAASVGLCLVGVWLGHALGVTINR